MGTINGMNMTIFDKIGMKKSLAWGYLGILIFMMGDGLEIAWMSAYLQGRGMSVEQTASLYTAYGVTVTIASFLSGVLAEAFGPRKIMFSGLILYIIGTSSFIAFGLNELNYGTMLLTYALRGFGYPLFAYSFMVWINYRSPKHKLGAAVGWFWFVFTGGLNVLGAYYSIWAIEQFGHIGTLWTSIFWVSVGALFAIVMNRDKLELKSSGMSTRAKLKELTKGFTILKREPKVAIGGVVRTINTTSQFAFPIFLPIHMANYGISINTWLTMWGVIFTSNIVFNVIFGMVGDKLGWRNTVIWFGGVFAGISTLLLFYMPIWTNGNLVFVFIAGMFWGASLAGYVPLSALVPSLVKEDKGAAVSVLNLGAGLPVFIGPALVGVLYQPMGASGLIWILAILYFISALLTVFIQLPAEEEDEVRKVNVESIEKTV
ncbi:MFS transporter [Peribacillus muralis]|uniref:MFS transporter n=1 Tax=Peribacillus muralis TaxID=264697 RepID=UPI003807B1F3